MQHDKLVYMANQIARFFASQPGDDQAQRVAAHLNDFWEPRMRKTLLDMIAKGDTGLDPLALEAAALVRRPA